jgi:hypothetical protein
MTIARLSMRKMKLTELRSQTKTVPADLYGHPTADIVPMPGPRPAWRNPPRALLKREGLSLSREVLADRER